MRNLSYLLLSTFTLLLSACSVTSPEMNRPIAVNNTKSQLPKTLTNIKSSTRSDELTLMMTFSGGGTRSAALSYGVLQKLRDTPVTINGKQRRLLDEIDLISSVSGGSFTSAYYGLFGDQIFKDFEKKFLKRPVQTELLRLSLLNPKAWIRLMPSLFERSDLAAEYYNQVIFKKKTFADMRPDAPIIVINATDLSIGQGFSFTGYHFNWICSDLDSYPISRAVAASAAVPVLFSPITLQNHAGTCKTSPIVWQVQERNRKNRNLLNKQAKRQKRHIDALQVKNYRDDKNLKYLHLVDGGVADNLGIRSIIDIISFHNDNMWNAMRTYGLQKSKKMVFISVNAASFLNTSIASVRRAPSTVNIIDTTTTIQSNKYNTDTIDLLRTQFPKWKQQVQTGRCKQLKTKDCADIDFQLIEINLEDLNDAEIAELGIVPTALELPNKTIEQLKAAGKNLLNRSEGFQNLLGQY
ncbi:MAG: NTE family protein [Cocleimonas sp.]|jgi:NTE family protein